MLCIHFSATAQNDHTTTQNDHMTMSVPPFSFSSIATAQEVTSKQAAADFFVDCGAFVISLIV
jgi:hypothetical protein